MKLISKYLPADQRRLVTIEAVIALAAEQNPGEITTSAIAERMNLTQGALFRHFPTKDAVWQAAMRWVAERLQARIDQAAQGANSPLAALEAMFIAHLDFVGKHPGVPRLLFSELQRAKDTATKRLVRTMLTQYAQRLHTLLEQGKQQGEVAPEVDTNAAATLFIGLIQGLIMQSLIAGKISRLRDAAPGAFALFARGVRRIP
ncbi:MAG: TetR/AcrR family transcriptional regulator [Opitutaceae bacterium]|nr:TetR/AcrR family transcriptional regulator [Opitutaceae bacterium]